MHTFSAALLATAALAPSVLARPSRTSGLKPRSSVLASSEQCGDEDYVILPDTPWIVYNMMYNADETVGTQCTNYDTVITASDGTQEVTWESVTNIDYVESTDNVPKGYSFVGLTSNLEVQVSGIESIPATYDWTSTNTTAFKGNVCFDFMTSDTKGDSTSSAAEEHMLWLNYEGGQLPIGTGGTTSKIDNLFGTSWTLYTGENTDTGITVRSLLPDTQFEGTFTGDLKDWMDALVSVGAFTDSTYVNVGNAGREMFYGDATMSATLGLAISTGTDTATWSSDAATTVAAVVSTTSTSAAVVASTTLSSASVAATTTSAPATTATASSSSVVATSAVASSSVASSSHSHKVSSSTPAASSTAETVSTSAAVSTEVSSLASTTLATSVSVVASTTNSAPAATSSDADDDDTCYE